MTAVYAGLPVFAIIYRIRSRKLTNVSSGSDKHQRLPAQKEKTFQP